MENAIFIKIMDLIERETDIPFLEKNLSDWLSKSETNQKIYKIYKMANMFRK